MQLVGLKGSACLSGRRAVFGGRKFGGSFLRVGFQWRPTPRCGWYWAARSLEFIAPDPPIPPFSNGPPAPIPTIAVAEKQNKRTKKDLDLHTFLDEPRKTLDASVTPEGRPSKKGDQPTPEDAPRSLGILTSDTSDKVRLAKHTRLPLTSSSKGVSRTNPLTDAQQIRIWEGKGKGKTEHQPAQPRDGYRTVPPSDRQPEYSRGGRRIVPATESREGKHRWNNRCEKKHS